MARLLVASRSMALALRLADAHEIVECSVDAVADVESLEGIDVVVLDLGDPGESLRTIARFRERGDETPVLVVPGYQPEWADMLTDARPGLNIVSLPITRAALLQGIAGLLGQPENPQSPPQLAMPLPPVAGRRSVQHGLSPAAASWPVSPPALPDARRDLSPPLGIPTVAPRTTPPMGPMDRGRTRLEPPTPRMPPPPRPSAPVRDEPPSAPRASADPPAPYVAPVPPPSGEPSETGWPEPGGGAAPPAVSDADVTDVTDVTAAQGHEMPEAPVTGGGATDPDDVETQVDDGEAQVDDGEAQVDDGEAQVDDGEAQDVEAPGAGADVIEAHAVEGEVIEPDVTDDSEQHDVEPPAAEDEASDVHDVESIEPQASDDGAPEASDDIENSEARAFEEPAWEGTTSTPDADRATATEPPVSMEKVTPAAGAPPSWEGEAAGEDVAGDPFPPAPPVFPAPYGTGEFALPSIRDVFPPTDFYATDAPDGAPAPAPTGRRRPLRGRISKPLRQPAPGRSVRTRTDTGGLPAQTAAPAEPGVHRPEISDVELIAMFHERLDRMYGVADTAQALADDVTERADADAAAVLVPDGATWRVVAGVGLRPLERRLLLEATHWIIDEVVIGSRALLIDDTDIVRQKVAGAPLAAWRHVMGVPVPEVRAAVILARGQDAGPFTERDLTTVVVPVSEAAHLLTQALQVRRLARRLEPMQENEDRTAPRRLQYE